MNSFATCQGASQVARSETRQPEMNRAEMLRKANTDGKLVSGVEET